MGSRGFKALSGPRVWECVGLGSWRWSCSFTRQTCLSSPSAASPQREPPWEEGLPWKELADEEGNVPGNGRQMFKFQRGRVEFERKPLTYVYDFMYRRKKCYLTHSWRRGERKWGNCEGQGHSSVLAAEKRRQLACVGSLTVPEAHVLLGH